MLRFLQAMGVSFVVCSAACSVAAASPCDQSALPSCSTLAESPIDLTARLGFETPRNGGVTFNTFGVLLRQGKTDIASLGALRSLSNMFTVSDARERVALKTASDLRDAAVSLVKGTTSPLSPEQRVLVQRLSTLNFAKASESDPHCWRDVPKGVPNSAYDAASHTLLICPAALQTSEFQLASLIGHELGHVANACHSTLPLMQIDRAKATKASFAACGFTIKETNPSEEDIALAHMITNETHYAVADMREPYFKKLAACGILKPVSHDAKVSDSTIYATTNKCLERVYAEPYNDAFAQDIVAIETSSGYSEARARRAARAVNPPACFTLQDESFADAFGAKVVGAISASWKKSDLQSAFLHSEAFACFEASQTSSVQLAHPLAQRRLETLMNDPQTAQGLACTAVSDPNLCPLKFDQAPIAPVHKKRVQAVH